MDLRLYKLPYQEPHRPRIARLLFEGKVDQQGTTHAMDFYVYVWIRDSIFLDSFQAVLADAITLIYRVPRYICTGRIGHVPFSRAICGSTGTEDRELMGGAMKSLHNEYFAHLLNSIERIAGGEEMPEVSLDEKEAAYFSKIMEKIRV